MSQICSKMLTFPFLAHFDVHLGFIKNIDNKKYKKALKIKKSKKWAVTCDFQKCGILTSVDLSVVSMINYNHQL